MTGSRPVTQQQCQLVLEPDLPIHLISPLVLLLSPHEQIFLQPDDLATVANRGFSLTPNGLAALSYFSSFP